MVQPSVFSWDFLMSLSRTDFQERAFVDRNPYASHDALSRYVTKRMHFDPDNRQKKKKLH